MHRAVSDSSSQGSLTLRDREMKEQEKKNRDTEHTKAVVKAAVMARTTISSGPPDSWSSKGDVSSDAWSSNDSGPSNGILAGDNSPSEVVLPL